MTYKTYTQERFDNNHETKSFKGFTYKKVKRRDNEGRIHYWFRRNLRTLFNADLIAGNNDWIKDTVQYDIFGKALKYMNNKMNSNHHYYANLTDNPKNNFLALAYHEGVNEEQLNSIYKRKVLSAYIMFGLFISTLALTVATLIAGNDGFFSDPSQYTAFHSGYLFNVFALFANASLAVYHNIFLGADLGPKWLAFSEAIFSLGMMGYWMNATFHAYKIRYRSLMPFKDWLLSRKVSILPNPFYKVDSLI